MSAVPADPRAGVSGHGAGRQATASAAEETASAAQELNAQSLTLKEAVGGLRLLVRGGRSARRHAAAAAGGAVRPSEPAEPAVGVAASHA